MPEKVARFIRCACVRECVHICNLDGPLESRKCRKQQKQIHMISSSTFVCMYVQHAWTLTVPSVIKGNVWNYNA